MPCASKSASMRLKCRRSSTIHAINASHDRDRGDIGSDDERSMRTEVHYHGPDPGARLQHQQGAHAPPHDLVAHRGQMQRQEQQRECNAP